MNPNIQSVKHINNNVPARDKIDYDATLFVCGYSVDEATTTDYVVVRCRICGAPLMRKMTDIKYHPDVQAKPCKECQRAFVAFRRIMWRDRARGRKNAAGRKWYAAHADERGLYQKRRTRALKGTAMDVNVYQRRHHYATRGGGSV